MRAVLLAALVGRLPLGSWEVNAAVCRPTKGTGNIWRLAGKQAEGLPASTAFDALAHAAVGDGEVTLCKVKLLEGKSVLLCRAVVQHPVYHFEKCWESDWTVLARMLAETICFWLARRVSIPQDLFTR